MLLLLLLLLLEVLPYPERIANKEYCDGGKKQACSSCCCLAEGEQRYSNRCLQHSNI